ncbi:MAG: sulfotransferase [Parvularculaceae bacterium]
MKAVGRAGLPSKPLSAAAIAAAATARWPFSTIEQFVMEERLPLREDLAPPVFILGHWRSGTTHLYNIMCKSGDWAFVPPVATGLPWDLFGIVSVFRPLLERALPKHRYIDNIPVKPDSPQEDEIAIANMTDLSFYHAIYFPSAFSEFMNRGLFFDGCTEKEKEEWRARFFYLMRKLTAYQDGKRLLIKNPVYTARLAMLRRMFPDAKFVHIRRNPYDVFLSMRNFYKKLFSEFALQSWKHVDIDETILSVYERMMTTLERDAAGLSPPEYLDLTYEELEGDALGCVRKIYDALELDGFAKAEPNFALYISSVKTFEKNKFAYSDEAAAKVEKRLGRFIDQWGYERPSE